MRLLRWVIRKSGRSSWEFVLQRKGIKFERGRVILHGGEVYDAELYGATIALRAALFARKSREKNYVLLDNQAAVKALRIRRTSSSLRFTHVLYELAKNSKVEVR